jgi:hypothetical protein
MRKLIVAGILIVVVAVGVLIWRGHLFGGSGSVSARRAGDVSQYEPGRPVPADAVTTAANLVTGGAATQRAALSPSLAAVLPKGSLFPAGSTIALNADSWEQAGQYANATGLLTEPGKAAVPVEIGFIDTSGTWLITFEEPVS